jgi:hypothetical protein
LYRLLRVHVAGYACFARKIESFEEPWTVRIVETDDEAARGDEE